MPFHFAVIRGFYFRVCIDLGCDEQYRDSFHEQEGCRIHYEMQDSLCAGWHAISIELASVLIDTTSYTIFNFAWGMLKSRVSSYISTRILLDRGIGSILIWGNNIDCF